MSVEASVTHIRTEFAAFKTEMEQSFKEFTGCVNEKLMELAKMIPGAVQDAQPEELQDPEASTEKDGDEEEAEKSKKDEDKEEAEKKKDDEDKNNQDKEEEGDVEPVVSIGDDIRDTQETQEGIIG